jgi:hypothetical protein
MQLNKALALIFEEKENRSELLAYAFEKLTKFMPTGEIERKVIKFSASSKNSKEAKKKINMLYLKLKKNYKEEKKGEYYDD